MRTRILVILFVAVACVGGWQVWTNAKEKATAAKDALWNEPYNQSVEAFQQKRYTDCEAILTGLLAETERQWPDSARMGSVLNGLGAVYLAEGKAVKALPYYRRAVEIRNRILHPDDPELATSLSGLGQTLEKLEQRTEAAQVEWEVFKIYQKAPQQYARDYGVCLLNLGIHAKEQHRPAEAEDLLRQAIAAIERYNGPDHEYGAVAYANLADRCLDQGRYAEGEVLYRKALAIQERRLRPDDIDLAITLGGLSGACRAQNKIAEADQFEARSDHIFASGSPTARIPAHTLLIERAQMLERQKRYQEAEGAYLQSIDAAENLGADKSSVADSLEALGRLYRDQEGFPIHKADPLFERALAMRQKDGGPEGVATARTMSDMALLYFYEKKYVQAETLANRALPIDEKKWGIDSLEVSTVLNRLGISQRDQGKFAQAEASLTRALAIREKKLPPNDSWIAISLQNLASVYKAEGQIDKAIPLIDRLRSLHGAS